MNRNTTAQSAARTEVQEWAAGDPVEPDFPAIEATEISVRLQACLILGCAAHEGRKLTEGEVRMIAATIADRTGRDMILGLALGATPIEVLSDHGHAVFEEALWGTERLSGITPIADWMLTLDYLQAHVTGVALMRTLEAMAALHYFEGDLMKAADYAVCAGDARQETCAPDAPKASFAGLILELVGKGVGPGWTRH